MRRGGRGGEKKWRRMERGGLSHSHMFASHTGNHHYTQCTDKSHTSKHDDQGINGVSCAWWVVTPGWASRHADTTILKTEEVLLTCYSTLIPGAIRGS